MAIKNITTFDPSVAATGTILNSLPGGVGTMIIYNDSAVNLSLAWLGNQKSFPAGVVDVIVFTQQVDRLAWSQGVILTNASAVPISQVTIDGYSSDEHVPGTYPFTIARLANIGNLAVPSTGGYANMALAYPTTVYDDLSTISGTSSTQAAMFFKDTPLTSGQSSTVTGTTATTFTGVNLINHYQPYGLTTNNVSFNNGWTLTQPLYFNLYDLLLQTFSASPSLGAHTITTTVILGDTIVLIYSYGAGASLYPQSATLNINGAGAQTITGVDFTTPQWLHIYRNAYTIFAGLSNIIYPLTTTAPKVYQAAAATAVTLVNNVSIITTSGGTSGYSVLAPANLAVPVNADGKTYNYPRWLQLATQ